MLLDLQHTPTRRKVNETSEALPASAPTAPEDIVHFRATESPVLVWAPPASALPPPPSSPASSDEPVLALAILKCNPQAVPIPDLDKEATIASIFIPSATTGTFTELIHLLECHSDIRMLMYAGHGDAPWDSAEHPQTLGLTDSDGNFALESPTAIASMIGSFSRAYGGTLELVVLSACCTGQLARLLVDAGVPYVVAWTTRVDTRAATRFSSVRMPWFYSPCHPSVTSNSPTLTIRDCLHRCSRPHLMLSDALLAHRQRPQLCRGLPNSAPLLRPLL